MAISISAVQGAMQGGGYPRILMPRAAFSMHNYSHLSESAAGAISPIAQAFILTGGGQMG
jgi:hypothetical protein